MQIDADVKILRTIEELCSIPERSMWLTDGHFRPGLVEGVLFAWPFEIPDQTLITYVQRLINAGVRMPGGGDLHIQSLTFSDAKDEGYGPGAEGYWKARFAEGDVRVLWNPFVYDPHFEAARTITEFLDDRTGTVPPPAGFSLSIP